MSGILLPPAKTDDRPFIPPPAGIRERFEDEWMRLESDPGRWDTSHLTVIDRETNVVMAEMDRNYSAYSTFEPFWQRQGDMWHPYALVSPHYTATSVMDLVTGEIVAGETPNSFGFCPVQFYVPDWWDVHDGSILPDSKYWDDGDQKPDGQFGFVAGCIWGDDSSWKIQYLDLSKIAQGEIVRDDRFGYIELPSGIRLREAITFSAQYFTIATALHFHQETGKLADFQREELLRDEG